MQQINKFTTDKQNFTVKMNNTELNKLLLVLNIVKDITDISLKEVNNAFRKQVKLIHPDKSGDENTEKCQRLIDAYKKLKEYFKINGADSRDIIESDIEEKFFRENFERFNFPIANMGSFTVSIEDYLADIWQECMENKLGEAKVNINQHGTECDRLWKVQYKSVEITIHLYNNPKNKKGSKLMLQAGKQSVLCSYVFDELPKVYEEVCQKKPKRSIQLPTIKRNSKPVVKCDLCKFKSSMIQMKMHIRNVHGSKQSQPAKRLQDFTPLVKSPKKIRKAKAFAINRIEAVNDTTGPDNSMILINDSFSGKEDVVDVPLGEKMDDKNVELGTVLPEDISLMNISENKVGPTPVKDTVKDNDEYEQLTVICGVCKVSFLDVPQCEKHMETHISTCYKCEYQCNDPQELSSHEKEHMKSLIPVYNQPILDNSILCGSCDETFNTEESLQCHFEKTHTIKSDYRCSICNLVTESQEELYNHKVSEHKHKCGNCTQTFESSELLTEHQQNYHMNFTIGSQTNCDQCDYKGDTVNEFITHLLLTHKNEMLFDCPYCKFKTNNKEEHKEHIEVNHVEFAMFGHIAMNQDTLTNSFEHFKKELTDILNVIIDKHNSVKQELFILRQSEHESQQKLKEIQNTLANLSNTTTFHPPKLEPTVPKTESKKESLKTQTRTCFVGDSIISNLDQKIIENAMDTEVTTARAYSSLENDEESDSKEKTRFPNKKFSVVIDEELKKAPADFLFVQSGSVDITNMKTTDDNLEKYSEYFKQEAVLSATNLFTAVTNSLITNTSVKKAVIMKHIPRYDTKASDPHSVKSALSQLYNNTLVQLWLSSPHKNRIIIGSHNLDCVGGIRDSRYKSKNQYDGIHMYGSSGKKAYNESVLEIIREANLIQKSPPAYFRRFHKSDSKTKSSAQNNYTCPTQDTDWMNDVDIRKRIPNKKSFLPTYNRFSSLSSLNC